jgi:hypothetical protein
MKKSGFFRNVTRKAAALLLSGSVTFNLAVFSQTGQNDLTQKLMMGYQGWFLCQGDGSAADDWRHWFRNSTDPSADQLNIDNWPDMSEYDRTYATRMAYPNRTRARLFSSHDESTTMTHFKWMRDYNIYGVYLQRFLGEAVNDPRFFEIRNNVLQNVINAARTHERHFAMMYDITGVPDDGLHEKLVNDWQYLIDNYDMTNQAGYVRQDGQPVVAVWGMGFPHNEVTAQTAKKVIDYFHGDAPEKYRAYVVGGVPGYWRTLESDSKTDPLWTDVYHSFDMISPWTVGRYNKGSVDNWKTQRIVPDLAECSAFDIDYMPVIFPGGSWFNQTGRSDSSRINDNPRDGGHLYWRQAFNAVDAGAQFLYVAMFDEVDEGTAMFKLAPNNAAAPAQGTFVTLDEDGYDLPSDWYLRLAGETQRMLDGSIPPTSVIPFTPTKITVSNVTVSPTPVTLPVGGTRQLIVVVTPSNAYNRKVAWKSSDTATATVSSAGRIRAVAVGSTTVTVTTQDGGLTAVCEVTVVPGSPVSGVTVSPHAVTLDVGTEQQLTATVAPADAFNKTVIWSTSNKNIVTVTQTGLVSAVAEGKVTVTATTQDGAKTATSQITVVDPSQIPYGYDPWPIPGIVEAEDYDYGGEGVAYHDLDAANQGGQHRTDEAVDIETCSEGGYSVGWLNAGEWLEYTVEVAVTGKYDLDAKTATQLNNARFHIEFEGVNKTGILSVPNTGGWQTWESVIQTGFSLNSGVQVMKVVRETDGADFNLNNMKFIRSTTSVPEAASGPAGRFVLHRAFPNPFNAGTKITFEIPKTSDVKIIIYDVLGQEIRFLVDRRLEPGFYSERWDGLDNARRSVSSGVYFIRMQAAGEIRTDKLMFLK